MQKRNDYRGVVVPMVSPFDGDGRIDQPAVGRVVERLLRGGVSGIFPLGTTGEAVSISGDDKRRLVEATVQAVGGRAMVYAGISGTCLRESVEAAEDFARLGADAAVAHPPFYYPLSDDELHDYYLALADRIPLPLVLYNIPATTRHSIAIDVVARLSEHPNIVAIKDSANDAQRLVDLLARTGGRGGFPVLLGCSALFTHGLKLGGVGLVPSGAHLMAEEYQQMYLAAMADNWAEVERLQSVTDATCARFLKGRSLGQSIAMLKMLLEQQGLCGRMVLPPLRPCSEAAVPVEPQAV